MHPCSSLLGPSIYIIGQEYGKRGTWFTFIYPRYCIKLKLVLIILGTIVLLIRIIDSFLIAEILFKIDKLGFKIKQIFRV